MRVLLLIHLIAVGLWLGCVLTEALFERALLGQGRAQELLLARLHQRVDGWIEVAAFLVVLLTGGLMLRSAAPGPMLHVKVALGLVAIVANAYCVGLVFRRRDAAESGRCERFDRLDRIQHQVGALVLVGILGALAVGARMWVRT